jgi:hypothetical protein
VTTHVLAVSALAVGAAAAFAQLVALLPKRLRWPAAIIAVLAYCGGLVGFATHDGVARAYRSHVDAVVVALAALLLLSAIVGAYAARQTGFSRSLSIEQDATASALAAEKFLHKEYLGSPDSPTPLTIDARRDSGTVFLCGRCLLLPAGQYRISADDADPGGWSAWEDDGHPGVAAVEGPWTWNLLVSIPGVTKDFSGLEYRAMESFRDAYQLGRWENAWVFKSPKNITVYELRRLGFVTSIEIELPTTAPVWFWLWDHAPQDNRGSVHVLLVRL